MSTLDQPALLTPSLLAAHRSLLTSLTTPFSLDNAITSYYAHFDVLVRITENMRGVTERWQIMEKGGEEMVQNRKEISQQQQRKQRVRNDENDADENSFLQRHSILANDQRDGDNDASCFAPPMVIPFSSTTSATSGHNSAVGILSTIPGFLPILALHHERQIEVAWRLLNQTRHDLSTSLSTLHTIFDAIHTVYDTQRAQGVITSANVGVWCNAACLSVDATTAAAGGSAKGNKKTTSSSGKKSSSTSSPSSAEQVGNSIFNIMQYVDAIEAEVGKSYDSHLVAWSELQSSLTRAAASSSTSSSQYQLLSSVTSISSSVAIAAEPIPLRLPKGFLHLDVNATFDAWRERHVPPQDQILADEMNTVASEQQQQPEELESSSYENRMREMLRRMRGKTPKVIVDEEEMWQEDEEEEEN